MQVRQLHVANFRGIKQLDWVIASPMVCLFGPGDSCKTTILDAIEWVLGSRWSLPVADGDFHNGDTAHPICIEATVGQVPDDLVREAKFMHHTRGWRESVGLVDEPDDDDEVVLTLRLKVERDLEPTWAVVTDRTPEGVRIAWQDRAKLGAMRLGQDAERHLSWVRGSALARLTDESAELDRVLADVYRSVRDSFNPATYPSMSTAAAKAAEHARAFGAPVSSEAKPGLDGRLVSSFTGALALHDHGVSVRALGTGSKRLAALAIQSASSTAGPILLIDEVEHGLEPHRIRCAIQCARGGTQPAERSSTGQVIMTTHSPVAIADLHVSEMRYVRSREGVTSVGSVPAEIGAIPRRATEGLLARRVIVCEGLTELGLLRALQADWQSRHEGVPVAQRGVGFVDGNGGEGPKVAMGFAKLGYQTCYLADSDGASDPSRLHAALREAGVRVVAWGERSNTEHRVSLDLPWASFLAVFDSIVARTSLRYVSEEIRRWLGAELPPEALDPEAWRAQGVDERTIRRAFARASCREGEKDKTGWFKGFERGRDLGRAITDAWDAIGDTNLGVCLREVESWAYA